MNKTVLKVILGIVVILVAWFFIYNNFFKPDTYLIEGGYYQFKLQTPQDWVARRNTSYSPENVDQAMEICQGNKSDNAPFYKIGMFRFSSKNYPAEFGDAGVLQDSLPSGIVLEISVSCVPEKQKSRVLDHSEKFLNFPVFGKIKQTCLLHNNLKYEINQYINISTEDKNKENKLRQNYESVIKKIISSISFQN